FFQAEDGIRDLYVTGVQTCALPIFPDAAEVRARATAAATLAVNAMGAIDTAIQNLASAIASPGSADTEARAQALRDALLDASWRSEERRVGKECRSRWSRDD